MAALSFVSVLSAAGDASRYAETEKPVEVIRFHPRLGKQKWFSSLFSSDKLLAIAKMSNC